MSQEITDILQPPTTENGEHGEGSPIEEVIETVVTVVEPELEYIYQPVDVKGRPLGGKQVIKYKTQDELIQKLTNQNAELVRLNRDLNKRNRLGDIEKDTMPEGIVFADTPNQPRELTPDERFQLSKDLLDPEKADSATDLLFEAKLGEKPEQIRNRLSKIDLLVARSECEAFINSTPEYYKCDENFRTLTGWMVKNNLAPTRSNFSFAFQELTRVGLLESAPIVSEVLPTPVPVVTPKVEPASEPEVGTQANSQPVQVESSRITREEPATAKRPAGVSSGLTREASSNEGIPVTQRGITLADVDKMSAEEYKRRLKDPAFRKAVDDLYSPKSATV